MTLDQEKLFFIVGIGRSGTSLLQEIMNTFEGFCNVGEALIDGRGSVSCYAYLQNGDYSHLERFMQENWTKEYFVEKSPTSIRFLPQLHERYPDANYIFLRRNPLKIYLSQANKWPRETAVERMDRRVRRGLAEHAEPIENYEVFRAKKILQQVRRERANSALFAKQITVRYEDIVKDVESVVSAIASRFNIKMNVEKAREVVNRPSYSSKRNQKYAIKEISDPEAIELIRRACELWNYS